MPTGQATVSSQKSKHAPVGPHPLPLHSEGQPTLSHGSAHTLPIELMMQSSPGAHASLMQGPKTVPGAPSQMASPVVSPVLADASPVASPPVVPASVEGSVVVMSTGAEVVDPNTLVSLAP